ncbi:transcriptional regulator (plasmid) [Streptomyces olivoreticuli]|uniref:transcriptional regulator n=1 Tax=Streptomyces olivoreticuli TaxID=68246 RepID=UPI0026597BF0|nr:transcriptional regulator [Streptomyces olivoreticuli]WKK27849.1 transcriptional regulator [Streptomyces olivoreticuli]
MHDIDTAVRAAVFAAVFITLYIGHRVGDNWSQTSAQAAAKGGQGWPARLACARHVLSLTLTKAVVLAPVALVLHLPLTATGLAIAFAVDMASHYWADRRTAFFALAEAVGRGGYRTYCTVVRKTDDDVEDTTGPGTAAFELDQSWHVLWLGIASLITAAL